MRAVPVLPANAAIQKDTKPARGFLTPSPIALLIQTSRVAGAHPFSSLLATHAHILNRQTLGFPAGEDGPIGRRRRARLSTGYGPDGVWSASSNRVALRDLSTNRPSERSCLPHRIAHSGAFLASRRRRTRRPLGARDYVHAAALAGERRIRSGLELRPKPNCTTVTANLRSTRAASRTPSLAFGAPSPLPGEWVRAASWVGRGKQKNPELSLRGLCLNRSVYDQK